MVQRLILDSGAIIAAARGNQQVRRTIMAARRLGAQIIIPPVVLTQTLRGGTRDAAVLKVLRYGFVTFVGARLALQAGELLGAAALDDAAGAQIMAEALRGGPCVLLTSDPDDMRTLAGGRGDVRIIAI